MSDQEIMLVREAQENKKAKKSVLSSAIALMFGAVLIVMPVGSAHAASNVEVVASTTSDQVIPRPEQPDSNGVLITLPNTPNVSYSYSKDKSEPTIFDKSDGEKYALIPKNQTVTLRAMPETGYRFEQGDSDSYYEEWDFEYDNSDLEAIPKPDSPSRDKNTLNIPESDTAEYFYLGVNKEGKTLQPTSVEQNEREIKIPVNGSLSIRAFPRSEYTFEKSDEPYTWDYQYDTAFEAPEPAVVTTREVNFTWVWVVVALAAAAVVVPVSIVSIRDKRDAIQSRQTAQESRTQQAERLMKQYLAARDTVMEYKTKIQLAISYPAMNDLTEEKTQEMTTLMRKAESVHKSIIERKDTVGETLLTDYRTLVSEFETAVEIAESHAKRVSLNNMSLEDKKDFKLAAQLLKQASSGGTPDALRSNLTVKLKETIDRINNRRNVTVPVNAMADIEKATRLELTR